MRLDGYLAPSTANFVPLTPLDFLRRALEVYAAEARRRARRPTAQLR